MEFTTERTYVMPVAFGPQHPHPAGHFVDVRTLMVMYRTTHEAIADVLPPGLEPGVDPLLYAYTQRCRGVNFLAGGEYRLFGVNVAARYAGSQGPIDGQYALILWETDMEAVIRGRELLGIPKLMAEVDDPEPTDARFSVSAWERGRRLARIQMDEGLPMDAQVLDQLAGELAAQAWFGWKHIPRIDGVGAEVSQLTKIGIVNQPSAGWECRGSLEFGEVAWEECPSSSTAVSGLSQVPLIEPVRAYRTEGTVTLTRADHRVLT